jgi:hypothetical protein
LRDGGVARGVLRAAAAVRTSVLEFGTGEIWVHERTSRGNAAFAALNESVTSISNADETAENSTFQLDRWVEAASLHTTPERLAELSRDIDPDVRGAVASNTRTPKEDLFWLEDDLFADIRWRARVNLSRSGEAYVAPHD